jgi:2-deoxy-D-gluconate 3-dehydrogenase
MEVGTKDRFSLLGSRIMVTGASRGLGQGLALAMVQAGAEVIGIARSQNGLKDTQLQAAGLPGRFECMSTDLTAEVDLDRFIARAWDEGRVTDIIHAAGIQLRRPAVEITREDWRRVSTIQMEVPFFLSTALARRQLAEGVKGCHLFIGSLASWIGIPNISPYAACKSGVLGLMRTLAVEWAESGIRVNALCPGYFHTALTDDLFSDPDRRKRLLGRIPLGRLGIPEDLTGATIFLLSRSASYITGQSLTVDGGWLGS